VPEGYRKAVLPNGIRLVTEAMPHVRSVAVGVWVDTGSRVEPEERGGISHLIEHLVFKGTATRSAEAIARAIDSVGGHMDAFTAKEHTCFYVGVLDEHLPLAVDLLSDILIRPLFSADDIEKEKAVVLQEIKMVEDTPDDLIHDIFAEQVWAGHPLGRPILGQWERVKGFDRATILRHFEEEYAPGRITVAVAGHVEHERVYELFASRFEGFGRPAAAREGAPPRLRPVVHMASKPLEQVHMVLGFPGIADVAPERYALYLLNDVIGGSMSSRLFQEVRERRRRAPATPAPRATATPASSTSTRERSRRTSARCSRRCSRRSAGSRRTASPPRSSGGPRITSRATSCSRWSPPPAA
jgi:predicted Zn-dependent peptidase